MSEFETKLTKCVDNLITRFKSVRTNRTSPDLLDGIVVDYYGSQTPLKQLANISVPDSSTLSLQVFDKSAISAIEKALVTSSLGINPHVDGTSIVLRVPPLTAERRNQLVKQVNQFAEEARIGIRNLRRSSMDDIKKNTDLSDDDKKHEEQRIQKVTERFNQDIGTALEKKVNALTTV
ncbi:ribosome recycling factor [Candidatus Marinamargulisbacteria bacterium]|nr:ribosome recycling factor [bacterium]MDA7563936.1 ribosome recycling factor [Candidatus Marinamargulisbacteria bacterium]MDG2264843.1 ribosome recycling factor [Candidatus Marinamargulisbacteria bacterium]|tara:strand:+ start:3108 stop:3641 length:534 start_codon:yes stop_codon:yes gene_type:complete